VNRRLVPILLASVLVGAACGGGDDATEAVPQAAADSVSDGTEQASSSSAEIIVQGLDEMPAECVDLMTDFLVQVEPVVSEVDWKTATSNEFQTIAEQLDEEFSDFDAQTTSAGCDAYDFGDDADSLTAMIGLAEQKAPGVIGWLEFLGTLSSDPASGVADAPSTCDDAIAYIEQVMADTPAMGEVPISDMAVLGQAMSVISNDCDPQRSADFIARADVTDFMAG